MTGKPEQGTATAVERVELAPGYSVPRMIIGGWQLSQGHAAGGFDRRAVIDSLFRLADAGFTTFDCGDIYSGVEELLGEFSSEYRARPGHGAAPIQVHTKFVPDLDALPTMDRGYVTRVIDRSLRRLRVERLDLVQFHWWDYTVPRYAEVATWLGELVRAGKIRHVGVTNFDVPHLREIVEAGVPVVSHQVQYSLLDRRAEHGMVELCRGWGIALLSFGTVAGGFLADRYHRAPEPAGDYANRSLTKYHLVIDEFGGWALYQELLAALDHIARRHGVEVTNVAVRWALDRPQVAAAIVGARNDRYLTQNLKTFGVRLDAGDRDLIERVIRRSKGPAGDIYDLERVRGGRHAVIMKYNLSQAGGS